ncbi:uncharacterized protein LOC117646094 isoform X1 [Thrips palmi]|uniref:Uncharacterized protein LOC117646094 isoform X1 n=1 Tax=Thrips palmi TaxID=161013 RepID=A0A6P8ZNN8_THRPL|nr:uncharacterized protein LOC117646094 isoform X1 [Thrips palmi]
MAVLGVLLVCALSALLSTALPTWEQVEATRQLHDAADYEDPLAKAVMECSDMVAPVIGELSSELYVDLSRTCCEDAALAVVEGRALASAAAAAARCFSRTLYPRAAKPAVARLVRCVRDLLVEE